MENTEIKVKIRRAIQEFIKKDRDDLLKINIYEPTISHRIALYLETPFIPYNVDCEYSKNLDGDKKSSNGKVIRPDIIIHERLSAINIAIIEIKKNGVDSKLGESDIEKLK